MYVFSEKHVRLFPKTRTCFFKTITAKVKTTGCPKSPEAF